MTDEERDRPEFQCPKKWFPKKDWQRTKKQKVFGLTASSGEQLAFLVPKPWDQHIWANLVTSKVLPFLKKIFPNRSSYQILLDGEHVLHTPAAKRAFAEAGITIFPGWPGYSPDLNPQENVWVANEEYVREQGHDEDTFEMFQAVLVNIAKRYL